MPGRSRHALPVITGVIVIPAAVVAIAAAGAGRASPAPSDWQPQILAAPVAVAGTPTVAARYAVVAHRPAPRHALPPGRCDERALQVKTILVERAISARFPEITDIGGVRADSMRWHPEGLAIDVVIPDSQSAAGRALGDRILAFAFANAVRFGLVHVIWQQTYYPAGGRPHRMADLGSADANHYTHVHIATDGGGYPRGGETYLG